MSDRFSALIATTDAVLPPPAELYSCARILYPNMPLEVEATAQGDRLLLQVGRIGIDVSARAHPIEPQASTEALALEHNWPEAAAVLAAHTAHLHLVARQGMVTHGEALPSATALTLATSLMAILVPSVAVIWRTGSAITESTRFVSMARQLARGRTGTAAWLGFRYVLGEPDPWGRQGKGIITTGLRPFIGREVEWRPGLQPIEAVLPRLADILDRLIEEGPVVADGETLGITPDDRIRARHLAEGLRPGVPVIQLTAEALDQTRELPHPRALAPWEAPAWATSAGPDGPRPFGRKRQMASMSGWQE